MKTVFTLGPASKSKEIIIGLSMTADRFRLNSSHLTIKALNAWLSALENIYGSSNRTIPVVIDLQGTKYRIGEMRSVNSLPGKVKIIHGQKSNSKDEIPVPEGAFFDALQIGDIININDAKVVLQIETISPAITATVVNNGPVEAFKGINRYGSDKHPVSSAKISKRDEEIIKEAMKFGFTEFALSFVYDGKEADALKALTGNRRSIAKVERVEAMPHITEIGKRFDEVWFCRGDMGAEAGLYKLAELQKKFVSQFKDISVPKYLAGQVLEHMTSFPQPTRSEAVHLYDIVKEGFDGIVLSDETAIGKDPLAVAEFLRTFRP